ncbi:rhombosortase [Shewanella pneumatophori]|uniref:rhombosortase n=1 Tax=Shewanella pneumatophori TaxID=314092 RepID=UPI003B838DBF
MALLVSVLCSIFYFADFASTLAYQRYFILDGQWWRLITGNLLHTNFWHLLMNLAGFWVIVALHEQYYRMTGLALLFTCLCLLQGLGLLGFYPELIGYVGLSGMLHGLFTYGAVFDIRQGYKSGYLLLLGVIVKVAYEQYFGASAEVTELINARVATEAHLVGLVCGIACAVIILAYLVILKKDSSRANSH